MPSRAHRRAAVAERLPAMHRPRLAPQCLAIALLLVALPERSFAQPCPRVAVLCLANPPLVSAVLCCASANRRSTTAGPSVLGRAFAALYDALPQPRVSMLRLAAALPAIAVQRRSDSSRSYAAALQLASSRGDASALQRLAAASRCVAHQCSAMAGLCVADALQSYAIATRSIAAAAP